jgi:cytochrome c-type biogenesis protein
MLEVTGALYVSVFIAGVLMFLAPCTLPLMPGFLSILAGKESSRVGMVRNAFYFCLGFSSIFIALGIFAESLVAQLSSYILLIKIMSGVIIILLALQLLGFLSANLFIGGRSFIIPRFVTRGSRRGAFLLGTLFSFGWSPCIGPVLASVLFLSATGTTAHTGFLLLCLFTLGFSLPLMATAYFFGSLSPIFAKYAQLSRYARYAMAALLIVFGVLLISGTDSVVLEYGTKLFYASGLDFLLDYY